MVCAASIGLPLLLFFYPWPLLCSAFALPVLYVLALVFFVFAQFERSHQYWWLVFFTLAVGSAIFSYAHIYLEHGITTQHLQAGSQTRRLTGEAYVESLYFSVVTWTTLGYGDLAPAPRVRLLAAFQALLGYTSMGVLVGCLAATALDRR
ncbi:MAG: potassium channel family protein [Pseudomonadota bacterium]